MKKNEVKARVKMTETYTPPPIKRAMMKVVLQIPVDKYDDLIEYAKTLREE